MRKPANEWSEDDVLSLPQEDDTFERKGTALLDLNLLGANEDAVRDELAKQLSAFANTGGGQIIYGLTDEGNVDHGGVSTLIKGRQKTKEWLEDLIPVLTEFEVMGVNVYEIRPQGNNRNTEQGKAIFVIDVPDSDRAPHQSKRDLRYYVRLGGKSGPAPHRMIEDIRNRQRHPCVVLSSVEVYYAMAKRTNSANLECEVRGILKLVLSNEGKVKASDVALLTEVPNLSFSIYNHPGLDARFGSRPNTIIWQLRQPVYPGLSVPLDLSFTLKAELKVGESGSKATLLPAGSEAQIDDLVLAWTTFADSAPAKGGQIRMGDLEFQKKALQNFQK